jgi:hypothetical protein
MYIQENLREKTNTPIEFYIWLRLAIVTTNDLMINQYCSDWILFYATCFSPHGTIIRQ